MHCITGSAPATIICVYVHLLILNLCIQWIFCSFSYVMLLFQLKHLRYEHQYVFLVIPRVHQTPAETSNSVTMERFNVVSFHLKKLYTCTRVLNGGRVFCVKISVLFCFHPLISRVKVLTSETVKCDKNTMVKTNLACNCIRHFNSLWH